MKLIQNVLINKNAETLVIRHKDKLVSEVMRQEKGRETHKKTAMFAVESSCKFGIFKRLKRLKMQK